MTNHACMTCFKNINTCEGDYNTSHLQDTDFAKEICFHNRHEYITFLDKLTASASWIMMLQKILSYRSRYRNL